jgi:hypothetical protein
VSAQSSKETAPEQAAAVSPQTPEANMLPDDKVRRAHTALSLVVMAEHPQHTSTSTYTHPIDTDVPSGAPDRTTPRAQTRQEHEDDETEGKRRSSRASLNLAGEHHSSGAANNSGLNPADIAESEDVANSETASSSTFEFEDSQPPETPESKTSVMSMGLQAGLQTMGEVLNGINETEREIAALRNALNECWTLCNTLAKLSQNHRQRMFHYSGGHGDAHEHAWKTCWRLCQTLYENRNEHPATQVSPTLDLCRDFCLALFEVRQRGDEAADSVLRVSFELNNHLYNAHDRNLPEAFRERTLDFYLTLCHRLMKQRTSLPEETDSLLHACWSLAEMLFSIRQNSRDGKPADEEIYGSAIQACWELCDLFREGWTQVRPERGTPRPSQYTFPDTQHRHPASVPHSRSQTSLSDLSDRSSSMNQSYHSAVSMGKYVIMHPETPTTIFDDREEFSPAEDPIIPNILILGPEAGQTRTHDRWSSSSSNLSTYSDTSQSVHSSSTATAGREDPNLIRLKGLIVKAAINAGYSRQIPLPDFVRSLPSNSFGVVPWQTKLFESYKKLVLTDPTLKTVHTQPLRRLTASEIGRAVNWMSRSVQFAWLADLYRFVFGNYPDDTNQRNIIINA